MPWQGRLGQVWAPKTMLISSVENMFNFFMFRSNISKIKLFFKNYYEHIENHESSIHKTVGNPQTMKFFYLVGILEISLFLHNRKIPLNVLQNLPKSVLIPTVNTMQNSYLTGSKRLFILGQVGVTVT